MDIWTFNSRNLQGYNKIKISRIKTNLVIIQTLFEEIDYKFLKYKIDLLLLICPDANAFVI